MDKIPIPSLGASMLSLKSVAAGVCWDALGFSGRQHDLPEQMQASQEGHPSAKRSATSYKGFDPVMNETSQTKPTALQAVDGSFTERMQEALQMCSKARMFHNRNGNLKSYVAQAANETSSMKAASMACCAWGDVLMRHAAFDLLPSNCNLGAAAIAEIAESHGRRKQQPLLGAASAATCPDRHTASATATPSWRGCRHSDCTAGA